MTIALKQRLDRAALTCMCCDLGVVADRFSSATGRLLAVMALVLSLWCAELAIGVWSHSLSLLADAGHLFLDVGALGLTLAASWVARRPAAGRATFGYWRVESLAALVNGLSLVAIATLIAWEAVLRFKFPEPILSLPLLLGAGLGLAVNGLNLKLLHKHSADDINIKGAFLHVVADVASSIGILLAALVIYGFHWLWVDAATSLLIACLTGLSALPLLWSSVEMLLNYAPKAVDPEAVKTFFVSVPGVCAVDRLHIWSIANHQTALCVQLTINPLSAAERDRLLAQLQKELVQTFGIHEPTLQFTNRYVMGIEALQPLFGDSLLSLVSEQSTEITALIAAKQGTVRSIRNSESSGARLNEGACPGRPLTEVTSTLGDTLTMSILGKRLRRMAFFLVGLVSVLALSFSSIMADQSFASTKVWGTDRVVTSVRPVAGYDAASSHLERNFYQ